MLRAQGAGGGSRRGQGARGASDACHTCGVSFVCSAVGIKVMRCTMHSNKLSSTIYECLLERERVIRSDAPLILNCSCVCGMAQQP